MISHSNLLENGYLKLELPFKNEILPMLEKRDWKNLDDFLLSESKKDGKLFLFLSNFLEFNHLEHIIAIRSAPDDEDGIWHDDGSRLMAFSLSLNLDPESIEGGELLFRKKADLNTVITIKPAPFGTIFLFLTGQFGFDHKVNQVTKGERKVVAGWCSLDATH